MQPSPNVGHNRDSLVANGLYICGDGADSSARRILLRIERGFAQLSATMADCSQSPRHHRHALTTAEGV